MSGQIEWCLRLENHGVAATGISCHWMIFPFIVAILTDATASRNIAGNAKRLLPTSRMAFHAVTFMNFINAGIAQMGRAPCL